MSEHNLKRYSLWLITAAICLLIVASIGFTDSVPFSQGETFQD